MIQGLQASELSWNYPAWSISVEFIAYLGFPFALLLIWKAQLASKVAIAAVLVAALTVLAYLTGGDFIQWDGPQTLLRCLPELAGLLLYNAFRTCNSCAIVGRDIFAVALFVTAILLLHFGAPDLLIVATFGALMLAVVANTGIIARALNIGPLVWLGEISYSLYFLHGFIQFITTKLLELNGIFDRADLSFSQSLVITGSMTAVSLLLAHVSFYGVEIWTRRSLRELLRIGTPKSDGGARR